MHNHKASQPLPQLELRSIATSKRTNAAPSLEPTNLPAAPNLLNASATTHTRTQPSPSQPAQSRQLSLLATQPPLVLRSSSLALLPSTSLLLVSLPLVLVL